MRFCKFPHLPCCKADWCPSVVLRGVCDMLLLTGQRCSQPARQRGTESARQAYGRLRIPEIRKCRQRFPGQPLCHRRGGRVSHFVDAFPQSVFQSVVSPAARRNGLTTVIVSLKWQRGVDFQTGWALVWSNKHPGNSGKALLFGNSVDSL